jgi:hypothetical protein
MGAGAATVLTALEEIHGEELKEEGRGGYRRPPRVPSGALPRPAAVGPRLRRKTKLFHRRLGWESPEASTCHRTAALVSREGVGRWAR